MLNRADITVFTAATTDEMLKIHIEETFNSIVTMLDMPGTSSEAIFGIIQQSQHLKKVHIIMLCEDSDSHRARCRRCGAHVILPLPVDPGLLQDKVKQYLNVARRKALRIALNISVDGKFKGQQFLCRTENISVTGMLIRAELGLSLGDNISCSFYLSDMPKIDVKCEVVRIGKEGDSAVNLYGLKFTKISAVGKVSITAYVENKRAAE
jgi:hypothetical protein